MVYRRPGAGGYTALERLIRTLRDRYSRMDYPDFVEPFSSRVTGTG